jgi:hypothetical protein
MAGMGSRPPTGNSPLPSLGGARRRGSPGAEEGRVRVGGVVGRGGARSRDAGEEEELSGG